MSLWSLRRRVNAVQTLALTLIFTGFLIFLFAGSIIYGTRTENPRLPAIVQGILPAGRCQCQQSTLFACDSCLDCAASQTYIGANNTSGEDEPWIFTYPRDANDYSLDDDQCQAAFPGLFEDIDRATKFTKRNGNATEQMFSSLEMTKGMVRAMIYNGELYVISTHSVDSINHQKAVGVLASLHRAIVAAPRRSAIPNIEWVSSIEDLPANPDKPIWSLARRAQDEALWLMPDFGFWSWDIPQLGAFSEVADEAIRRERFEPWDKKQEKLVWRGKVNIAPKLRRALVEAARGKPWSDVGQMRWGHEEEFVGPVDQCNYKFIAHAEGRSYSGSLKYRQLCRSVTISHKLQWIQHFHYIYRASGPNQNFVEVERDWSDLSAAMDDLLANPEKTRRIADNSVRVFRERYLTAAAEACYWRRLIKEWKTVSFEPQLWEGVGEGKVDRGRKRGVRWETFMLYGTEKQMEYPPRAE